ncbi:MAG: patatin family protein [Mailhella sp.]|nr:patatin family protein [Mailhella sp.]
MRTGLVIEGGGVRGIYSAGVLDVFLEEGIGFDGVLGVSAGAIHGCSYVSGQKGRSIRYYRKYVADPRFMGLWSLVTTGSFVGEKFCYHDLPERLDPYDYDAFAASPTEFYVGCTNVETGGPEYVRVTDMRGQIDLLRASASLPLLSPIVEYGGMKLLDGGCSDSIPVDAFRSMGFMRNVVILTRHDGYEKKPQSPLPYRLFYRRYPAFCRAMAQRHAVYNRTLERIRVLEDAGEVFVIRPSVPLTIGRLSRSVEETQAVYDRGRADAARRIADLKSWLAVEHSAG